MRTVPLLLLAVVLAIGESTHAQPRPTYQRGPAVGGRPGHGGPTYQRRPVYPVDPQVAAGSFQRPYPYHLDYYRQRYGGGYEPYFGNLYGPPRVVGIQPFAASAYPAPATQAPVPTQPPTTAPSAAPMITCPHCGQPVQLQWGGPQP